MPRAAGSILVALVAALVLPGSVVAAKAERNAQTSTQFFCGDLLSEAGSAYVNAWLSDGGETFADLGFWAAPATPGESPMTWVGWSNASLMSEDGSTLEIVFGVHESNGDAEDPSDLVYVGEGTLAATLTPSGDVETFSYNNREGNHQFRGRGTWQAYDVVGSLALPGGIAFDLSGCEAARFTESWFANRPTATVSHFSELRLACGWETEDGYVSLFAVDGDFGQWADVFVQSADSFVYGGSDPTLSRSAVDVTFDLYSAAEDEPETVGSASARAELTTLGRVSETVEFGDGRFTAKGVVLAVSGTLTIELGSASTSLQMDDVSCQAGDIRSSQLPGRHERVKPVANDAPDAAIPLTIGDKLLVSTAGADEAPEASCFLDNGEGGTFEGPITYTVWWRIEGTGGPITIDTGGSTFDTIVAVYAADGDAVGEHLGCVDDVEDSLQARITIDTATDASYFVQTGGFGGERGDLSLLISE
jgi:hypothetical protein